MEQLVSVIVPVYNIEEYLDECIESIVLQTYKNLEIVLIDDGSTDLSGKKCDEWKARDKRIMVIHQENKGLSAARNKGIAISRGEWIVFVDSDDIVSLDYVAYLYMLAKTYKVQIVQCERGDLQGDNERENVIDKKMSSRDFLLSFFYQTTAWGKIYKKILFEKERYPVGKIHEDMAVTYKLVYMAQNIVYTSKILYFVRQRTGSITRKEKFYKERLDILQFYKEQTKFYEERNEKKLVNRAYREYAYALLENYNKTKKSLKNKKIESEIREEYRKICLQVVSKDDVISYKTRVFLILCFFVPELWKIVMKND